MHSLITFRKAIPFSFILLSWTLSSVIADAQSYTVKELPSMGSALFPVSVSLSGDVAGTYQTSDYSKNRAFLYRNGVQSDLGALGTDDIIRSTGANNFDTVVGYSFQSGGSHENAFSYANGIMTNLGSLGGTVSLAYAINDAGTIVGYSRIANDTFDHAFIYQNGTMFDLGAKLGYGQSYAYDISENGTVVGSFNGSLYTYSEGDLKLLGKLGQSSIQPSLINDSGAIAGIYSKSSDSFIRGFYYANGVFTDVTLAGKGTEIRGMNNEGQLVGYSVGLDGNPHGFLFEDGIATDLNKLVSLPGDTVWVADGINDLGEIVVSGRGGRAYLLTPVSAVPEPATYSIFGVFLLIALTTFRRVSKGSGLFRVA